MNPAVLKGVLALHGGMPVRNKRLPAWPYFAEDEIATVADVMRSGSVNYCTGEQGRQFENEFADACCTKHAVAVANGTVALELALRCLGIRPGDHSWPFPPLLSTFSHFAFRRGLLQMLSPSFSPYG